MPGCREGIAPRWVAFVNVIMKPGDPFPVSCAICEVRKEKRFCPAIHGRICPQCCGEQREVTLDCPSDCPYLQQARAHEKPRQAGDLDLSALMPQVELPDSFLYEHEHLIMGLTFALTKRAHAQPDLHDADLLSGTTALARSYERLVNSGLHYEEPMQSPAHQEVAAELQNMVKEYREAEQKHMGYTKLRDADVLRGLVFLLRMGHARTSGRPKSRAFIEFLFAQFPDKPAGAGTSEERSHIILP